jgi:ribosome maturation factor RimP
VKKEDIVRHAWQAFEPQLQEQHYELVELEYVKQGSARILRIYIDKADNGITHDDCMVVSQLLSPMLDADDFIGEDYVLEVSSPGIARPVRKAADFARFVGEAIRLETYAASDGRRKYTGILKGFSDGLITVECDGRSFEIHIENLKKAQLNR